MSAVAASSARSNRRVRREVRRFEGMAKRGHSHLAEWFGEETAHVMRDEILEEYGRLIPGVPDIGGNHNPYTPYLMQVAQALAVYRVFLRHGATLEDFGEFAHHRQRAELDRIPRVVLHWMGRHLILGTSPKRFRAWVRRTQERRYPDDCVAEWVDGDGESFDYGIDMIECASLKYLKAQGAEEMLPYLCAQDLVFAEKMGVRLQRTKTLSWGCDKCDFRYTLHGSTTAPWPPEFAERTCGRPATTKSQSEPAQ